MACAVGDGVAAAVASDDGKGVAAANVGIGKEIQPLHLTNGPGIRVQL